MITRKNYEEITSPMKDVCGRYKSLEGHNIMFEYSDINKCIFAHGVIPMELADGLFSDLPEIELENRDYTYAAQDSKTELYEAVSHPYLESLLHQVVETQKNNGVKIDANKYNFICTEIQKDLLINDNDNCYIDFVKINTLYGFHTLVNKISLFYQRKFEENKGKSLSR